MAIMKWRDVYNTGVSSMDAEHHKLVELIEIMYTATRQGATLEKVMEALAELITYTTDHFASEERLMDEYGYPGKEEHVAEHEQLKKDASEFSAQLRANFPEGNQKFYQFLREWLINHILDVDKKLGDFILEKTAAQE